MTTRLPSLNGLRAFEAAARHLSFTRAAAELNVTQTAISHQIRRLEEQLGCGFRPAEPRAAADAGGQDYLPGVRAAFEDLRQATERLRRPDRDHVLTVSTMASLAAKWLLPRRRRVPGGASRHRGPHHHLDRTWSISGARRSMSRCAMAAAIGRACAPTG